MVCDVEQRHSSYSVHISKNLNHTCRMRHIVTLQESITPTIELAPWHSIPDAVLRCFDSACQRVS